MVLRGLWGPSVCSGPIGSHHVSLLAPSCPGLSIGSHQKRPGLAYPTWIAPQSSASAAARAHPKTIQINHALFFLTCSALPRMQASAQQNWEGTPTRPRAVPHPLPLPRLPVGSVVPSGLRFMCMKKILS